MLTTHESDAAAYKYLRDRDAIWKLQFPVSLLFTGNPRHAEALRRKKRAAASRCAWAIPFALISLNTR